MEVHVTVQVHCIKPSWINYEKNRYRLYVNDYLLTERDWVWDADTYIEEAISIDVDPGSINFVKIEPILNPLNSVAKFGLRILKVNGFPRPDLGGEMLGLSFPV